MTSSANDRVEDMVDDARGRGKMAIGDLTDNAELREEGGKDRPAGAVKQTVADAKDKISDLAGRVSDKVKSS